MEVACIQTPLQCINQHFAQEVTPVPPQRLAAATAISRAGDWEATLAGCKLLI